MSRRTRILLVDDSVVVRRSVGEILAAEPTFEVVGTAPNGRIALDKIAALQPDVVVLDLEMPEMDGLETLRRIRAKAPSLPVLIFSGLTERGGLLTLDALSLGASDYVTKPSSVGRDPKPVERASAELIAKTRALAARRALVPTAPERRVEPPSPARIELVVLAASTGGPPAVHQVMAQLTPSLRVPLLIVQHMPPLFTKLFAERLEAASGMRVVEAVAGEPLHDGCAYVAPGDYHLFVERRGRERWVGLHQGPQENSCRPAADVLFRSAAQHFGAGVLGVVLTGMGQDGLKGCEAIRGAGGQVVVQDQATSVVWSMPGSVAMAGLADQVLPIDQIGPEILRRASFGPSSVAANDWNRGA